MASQRSPCAMVALLPRSRNSVASSLPLRARGLAISFQMASILETGGQYHHRIDTGVPSRHLISISSIPWSKINTGAGYLQQMLSVPTLGSYATISTMLLSLARKYEEITHEGRYCKLFHKFHQKLILKIPIFVAR